MSSKNESIVESGDIKKDLKLSTGDIAHTAVKAGFSAVPYVGGPAAEIFSLLIAPPLEKRRDKWLLLLHDELLKLSEQVEGFSIEKLKENESFNTILINATLIAMKTHQEEKIEALRNAVINCTLPDSPEEDRQLWFLNTLETLTPAHIKLLKFLDQEFQWDPKPGQLLAFSTVIEQALMENYPDSKEDFSYYRQLLSDLISRGLLQNRNLDMVDLKFYNNKFKVLTTLGMELLDYITTPDNRPVRVHSKRLVIRIGDQVF